MNLSTLLTNLSYGELSNLSMALNGSGGISENEIPKIILYANDGLTRLYSKFLLKQKDVMVEQVSHITNYHLSSKFAETNYNSSAQSYFYIKDLPNEPFKDDIIKILEVYDSLGCRLPLNDAEAFNSVFTPQANVLQVPEPLDGICLSVMYQASHPILTLDNLEANIELPGVLHSAFTAYIAYKVFSHINTAESSAKSQEHFQMYNALITESELADTVTTSLSQTNSKFYKRGWI